MHGTRPGKIDAICAARAAIKKGRREAIKMTLVRAHRRFFIVMQGRTNSRRKFKAYAWLYCAASSYQEREKPLT